MSVSILHGSNVRVWWGVSILLNYISVNACKVLIGIKMCWLFVLINCVFLYLIFCTIIIMFQFCPYSFLTFFLISHKKKYFFLKMTHYIFQKKKIQKLFFCFPNGPLTKLMECKTKWLIIFYVVLLVYLFFNIFHFYHLCCSSSCMFIIMDHI